MASAAAESATPKNVIVTDDQLRSYQAPWLARDPQGKHRLVVAYQDGSNYSACYLAVSSDNGTTWQSQAVAGSGGSVALPSGFAQCQRPAVAFGPDGTLYYVVSALQPLGGFRRYGVILVMTSRDGGRTFGQAVRVDPNQPPSTQAEAGTGDTLPRIAVDRRGGKAGGTIYVAWTRYSSDFYSQGDVLVAASSDSGKTFSGATRVNGPDRHADQIVLAVAKDGRLYAAYNDNTPFIDAKGPGTINVKVASSTDRGKSFTPPSTAATISSGRCEGYGCQEDATGNYSHTPAIDVAAAKAAGRVVLAMGTLTGPIPSGNGYPPGDRMKIQVATSKDSGATWSNPEVVGVPPGREAHGQLFPVLAEAPNGRLDLAYYDVAATGTQETYVASSEDGVRFSPPVRVSGVASDMRVGAVFGNYPYDGGHGLASTDSATLVVWADGRRGAAGNGKQDIVFAEQAAAGGSNGVGATAIVVIAVPIAAVILAGIGLAKRRKAAKPLVGRRRSAESPTTTVGR